MSASKYPYGLWVSGPCSETRVIVPAADAFRSYCLADSAVKVGGEAYLSAFQFGNDMRDRIDGSGNARGFDGPTWSPYLWFDIDRSPGRGGLPQALTDTRRLVACLGSEMKAPQECLLSFFSGSKGFHVGVPTALWGPEPGPIFHDTVKALARHVAAKAGVTIDTSVYDRVRLFRAPNSRHPKTGRHKVRLDPGDLSRSDAGVIQESARKPTPFEPPSQSVIQRSPGLAEAWRAASASAARSVETHELRRCDRTEGGSSRLNDLTWTVINGGPIEEGERARSIYSAAADLGELKCPPALAEALLLERGIARGLLRHEVARQIRCGLVHGNPLVEAGVEALGGRVVEVTNQEGPWNR